ncbi:MAG: 2,3-bisphosphoglycerate-independent phosphoglycerate mutase [bacterium]|nr:2,3-bisphosphoglycerate-independent phosphoglycerate mutase [bacterium]
MKNYRPVVLIILDGWGIAKKTRVNAIAQAQTPVFDRLIKEFPTATLQASGEAVGLPWQEMGNSEVGHLNLGAGRIVLQELSKINQAILNGSFFTNPAFLSAIAHSKKNHSPLHLMGLASPGGAHSHISHLYALLSLAKEEGLTDVFVHAFLDGRDSPPQSGLEFLRELEKKMDELGVGKLATICGRFFAMDRDQHWERVEKAYQAIVEGRGKKTRDFALELKNFYAENIFDENIEPLVMVGEDQAPVAMVRDNDAVIFFNFRPDRAREITTAFIADSFDGFPRPAKIKNLFFASMVAYSKDLLTQDAFPKEEIKMTLAETLSRVGLSQLHIAETEKYAHVTYFFNGGTEKVWPREDHILIPSLRNKSYADTPQMSAAEIAAQVVEAIEAKKYDFILVNFANADMVGHTGNLEAAVRAVEYVDLCLGKITEALLVQGGAAIVTADHGNAEQMSCVHTGTADTMHSKNLVPLILVAQEFSGQGREGALSSGENKASDGVLSDVAPTVLALLGAPKPKEMTGIDLLNVLMPQNNNNGLISF